MEALAIDKKYEEVIVLLEAGYSINQIADKLDRGNQTIRNWINNLGEEYVRMAKQNGTERKKRRFRFNRLCKIYDT